MAIDRGVSNAKLVEQLLAEATPFAGKMTEVNAATWGQPIRQASEAFQALTVQPPHEARGSNKFATWDGQ